MLSNKLLQLNEVLLLLRSRGTHFGYLTEEVALDGRS